MKDETFNKTKTGEREGKCNYKTTLIKGRKEYTNYSIKSEMDMTSKVIIFEISISTKGSQVENVYRKLKVRFLVKKKS